MIKKLLIGGLIAIVVGAVGVGAYDAYQGNSTLDFPEINVSQAAGGQGQGQGNGQSQGQGNGQGQGQGRGQGQGQGQGGQGQRQGQGNGQSQMVQHEWQTLHGTVVSFDAQSLLVNTDEQGQIQLQLGQPGFADEQGVTFKPGDTVSIQGFEENGQFQAGQIDNETTGQKLLLRDPNGRPLWAGPGREQNGGQGQGQGQGGRGQGQSQGGQGQEQNNGSGVPQAASQEWLTLTGTVAATDQRGLVVETSESGQITVELGPPWFAAEQAVAFTPGDPVTMWGFWGQGGLFQAGEITNDVTGQKLLLRDPNGRPLWAGQGQGAGQQGQQ